MSSESYYIKDQKATYFLTFTVQAWVDVFTRSIYRMDIVDSLNYFSACDYAGEKGLVDVEMI